jgi:tRNA/rRNA methyltransferase
MPPVTFVLVEPREEGNIGMVARAMANFGVERLVLVGAPDLPAPLDHVIARSAGRPILDSLDRAPDLRTALGPFHAAVAVSRRHGKHRNSDMAPAELLTFMKTLAPESSVAFVFGREADGLTVDEVAQCARVLAIPTTAEAPSLNLAQAAVIVAFSLFEGRGDESTNPDGPGSFEPEVLSDPPATRGELEEFFQAFEVSLTQIGFLQGDRASDSLTTLKRVLTRASLTGREVRLFRSLARKIGRLG